MAETPHILLIDKEQDSRSSVADRCSAQGYIVTAPDGELPLRNYLLYLGPGTHMAIPRLVITNPETWEEEPGSGRIIAEMQEINPAVPVIIYTALNLQRDARRFGNAEILRKQDGIDALMERVEFVLHPPFRVAIQRMLITALEILGQNAEFTRFR